MPPRRSDPPPRSRLRHRVRSLRFVCTGSATACTPARLGVTAGTADITCKLTDPVLRRRAKHRLRLHLKVDFLPSSGTPQEIRSDLTLPKRGG